MTVGEDLEFVVERLSSFQCFTAIKKNWFNVGVENADLGVYVGKRASLGAGF